MRLMESVAILPLLFATLVLGCDTGKGEVACVPACEGMECGLDPLCAKSCGDCFNKCLGENDPNLCKEGLCQDACCRATCEDLGKDCGTWDDSCGGSLDCGTCGLNEICDEHSGRCECAHESCHDVCCAQDQICYEQECCLPNCTDKVCGDDGCGGSCGQCCEGDDCLVVYVNAEEEKGQIPPLLLGQNTLGYATGWSDYSADGAGIWDNEQMRPVEQMVALDRTCGVSLLRFPGGCAAGAYHFTDAIGPLDQRAHEAVYWATGESVSAENAFGTDEFMAYCEAVNAQAMFTVNYKTGTPDEAADWVEYLNAPNDGSNPRGGTDWGAVRASNGHPAPYNARYFEIGNEVYACGARQDTTPETYSADVLEFVSAMKSVDNSIRVGVVLLSGNLDSPWVGDVISRTCMVADFYIVHTYWPWGHEEDPQEELFLYTLGRDSFIENYLDSINSIVLTQCPSRARDIDIAATEGGGIFRDNDSYRHSLVSAFVNVQMNMIFSNRKEKVFTFAPWHQANSWMGFVRSPPYAEELIRRPKSFISELLAQHWGTRLLDTRVVADTKDVSIGNTPYNHGIDKALVPRQGESFLQIRLARTAGADIKGSILWDGVSLLQDGSDRQLVSNGGFEQDLAGWSSNMETGQVISISGTDYTSGTKSLRIDYNGDPATNLAQLIPVVAGRRYGFSSWVKLEGLDSTSPQRPNLLNDPGAESCQFVSNASHGWSMSEIQGSTAVMDPSTSHDGNCSIKLSFSGQDINYYHVSQIVDVSPNTHYHVSAWLKTDLVTGPGGGVRLAVVDNRGYTYLAVTTDALTGQNDWTHVETSFETAEDTERIRVQLRRIGGSGENPIFGDAWFDDMELREMDSSNIPGVYLDFMDETKNVLRTISMQRFTGSTPWRILKKGGLKMLGAWSSSDEAGHLFIWLLNRSFDSTLKPLIVLDGYHASPKAMRYDLGSTSPFDNNESDSDPENLTVKIRANEIDIPGRTFQIEIEPHCLTVLHLNR